MSSFTTGEGRWWILGDDKIIIITKPENAVEMNREEHMYSLLYSKDAMTHTFTVKDTEMIIMTDYGITLYKKKDARDDSNKKNATKI
jgi:hypothetical protein